MRSEFYQKRLKKFICIITVIIQTALCFFGIWQTVKCYSDFLTVSRGEVCGEVEKNVNQLFSKLEEYDAYLQEIGIYAVSGGDMRIKGRKNPGLIQKKCDEINRKSADFGGYGTYIKKSYFLGRNLNNYSFGLDQNGIFLMNDVLPDREEADKAGFDDFIYSNYMQPVVFLKKGINLENSRVKYLADELEGETVYIYETASSTVFAVINTDYIKASMNGGFAVKSAVLRNKSGNEVYRTGAVRGGYEKQVIKKDNYTAEVYFIRLVHCRKMLAACIVSVLITIILALICFAYAGAWSAKIMRPYKTLGSILKMQYFEDNPSYIDVFENVGTKSTKSNILKNFITVTLLGLLLPSIVNAFFQCGIVENRRADIRKIQFEQEANSVFMNVTNKANDILCEMMLHEKITSDDFENSYYDGEYVLLNKKFSVSAYSSGSENESRESIYWDKERLKQSIISGCDAFFVDVCNREKNRGYLYVLKKQYTSGEKAENYCLKVVEGEKLGFLSAKDGTFCEVLNADGISVLASSASAKKEKMYSLSKQGEGALKNYTVSVKIPYSSLKSGYSGILNDYMKGYLLVILIIVVIIMAVWWYSISFISPLEKLVYETYLGRTIEVRAKDGSAHNEIDEIITAYNLMVKRVKKLIDEKADLRVKEEELKKLNAYAELKAFENQINPHFLYNTLEMVNMYLINNRDYEQSEIIVALTKMLRYSVDNAAKYVTLKEEIENLKNYILIQNIRFKEEFRCLWEIDEALYEKKIPKFILQPIVENSFKHGFADSPCDMFVKISAFAKGENIVIEIFDNGVGINEERLAEITENLDTAAEGGARVGMKNIYKRIKILTEGRGILEIESEFLKGTTVRIILPENEI